MGTTPPHPIHMANNDHIFVQNQKVIRGMNAHDGHEEIQGHAMFVLAQMFKYTR